MHHDVVIIGAGLAGLACARGLAEAGMRPLVLDRSGSPGGRAATRQLGGVPFDFGVVFGSSINPEFLDWVRAAAGDSFLPGWPLRLEGRGTPCQTSSFDGRHARFAVAGGVNQLAKREAAALEARGGAVRLGAEAVGLAVSKTGLTVLLADGSRLQAPVLVLALASPQAAALLDTLEATPVVKASLAVLDLFPVLPCLTVAALYPAGTPAPAWDLAYPENSRLLLLASNEGTKSDTGRTLLVYQARPSWSAPRLETDKQQWQTEILDEAARLWGPWASGPEETRPHRWKFSRLDGSGTAHQPLILPLGASYLALAGELFSPEGGLEGAWLSGRALARDLLSRVASPAKGVL